MAVLGDCPGTGVAACGESRRDAMVGVLGMLFGAVVFVAVYPTLRPLIEGLGDGGEVTMPGLAGVSPWAGVAGLVVVIGPALWLLGRRGPSQSSDAGRDVLPNGPSVVGEGRRIG